VQDRDDVNIDHISRHFNDLIDIQCRSHVAILFESVFRHVRISSGQNLLTARRAGPSAVS